MGTGIKDLKINIQTFSMGYVDTNVKTSSIHNMGFTNTNDGKEWHILDFAKDGSDNN